MNNEVKELKRLYKATIHGDSPYVFHKRIDNIPKTLVLYKTEGPRRIGAFESERLREEKK